MTEILEWFYVLYDNWPALFLFLTVLGIINAFIPAVPIEGMTILGGYLSVTGHGNLSVVWLAPSLGMLLGSMLLFRIVRINKEWLFRWKLIKKNLTPEDLNKGHDWFERYGVWAIFFSRFIPGMGLVMIFSAGLSKMAPYRILPVIAITNLLYFGGTVLIGRFVKEEWEHFMELMKPALSWGGSLLILIGGVAFLLWRIKRKKQ